MHLVQILLPLRDNRGERYPGDLYGQVSRELTERFGGMTAFTRSPAEGLWQPDEGEEPAKDEVVLFEIMADALDRGWWAAYRADLEGRFRQEAIVVRAQATERL